MSARARMPLQAGGPADRPAADALDQRLRLICDLADALAKQTEWVGARAAQTPALRAASGSIEDLGGHVQAVQDAAQELRHVLSGDPAAEPPSHPAPAYRSHTGSRAGQAASSAGADSVALDMRMHGATRAEVEQFLRGEFQLENAGEIAEQAFRHSA